MFTGIIECKGIIKKAENIGSNRVFWIASPLSIELKIDQSVAHEGVCLTVEAVENQWHLVTAIEETILKTNIKNWKENTPVNIERCMTLGGRLDGHLVQGHVDCTGTCLQKEETSGSWIYHFSYPSSFAALLVEKGSICLNGTSLTVFNVSQNTFSVAIIPYTYEHTTISDVFPGSEVNLEFDIIGKYILRHTQLNNKP